MRKFLKLGKVVLAGIGLIVIGLLGFWALVRLQDVVSPVLGKEQAVHVALNYLADKNVLLDLSTANAAKVFFHQGSWYIMFVVDPAERPAAILIGVNPITGKAKGVPLR